LERDVNTGKYLLKMAHRAGNAKAADFMMSFGIIKSHKELEVDLMTAEEE
jgi:hypothetical protein